MPFDLLETTSAVRSDLSLSVRLPDGRVLTSPARAGTLVGDALSALGLPLVPHGEARIVSVASRHRPGDRCTCRIGDLMMTPELDGLELELSWDALVPQTFWVAG